MGGIDNLFSGGDNVPNPIDVLNTLLDKKDIEMKGDLNMTQIKILCQVRWFKLIRDPANKDKTASALLDELMEYAQQLMVSYKRQSRTETIKGISDMSQKMMEAFSLLSPQPGMKR